MVQDVELQCRCGEVHGQVRAVSPTSLTRVICYCNDCRAFAHHLGHPELLDEFGGSDIVQVAPARVSFDRGTERIVGLRLTAKGLYRWHTSCCKTAVGNTLAPWLPFVGFADGALWKGHQAPELRDRLFGPVQGGSFGQFAKPGAPAELTKVAPGVLLNAGVRMLRWKIAGQTWPHPFFDRASKKPRYPVEVMPGEQREALREACGSTASPAS